MQQPNLDSFDDIVCECGNPMWMEITKVKLIPALMNPTNMDMPYPYFATLICANCGKDVRQAMENMKKTEKSSLIL